MKIDPFVTKNLFTRSKRAECKLSLIREMFRFIVELLKMQPVHGITLQVKFPRFDGNGLEGWLLRYEYFFVVNKIKLKN